MGVHYVMGDILSGNVCAIVNETSCNGKLSKGLGLRLKKRFPSYGSNFAYLSHEGYLRVAKPTPYKVSDELTIVTLPTSNSVLIPTNASFVKSAIENLVEFIKDSGFKSIAIPKIASGYKGCDWADVKKIIDDCFAEIADCEVYVYGEML